MTSKLKCPACSVELSETNDGFFMFCHNNACPDCNKLLLGTKELWQALIQAKQDLEIATRALEVLKECRFQGGEQSVKLGVRVVAQAALEQIEHKE